MPLGMASLAWGHCGMVPVAVFTVSFLRMLRPRSSVRGRCPRVQWHSTSPPSGFLNCTCFVHLQIVHYRLLLGHELWRHSTPILHRNRSLSKGLFQPLDTFPYRCFLALMPALGLAPSLPGNSLYSHDCYFWHDCHIRHCRRICTRGGRGPTPVWPLVHWLAVRQYRSSCP